MSPPSFGPRSLPLHVCTHPLLSLTDRSACLIHSSCTGCERGRIILETTEGKRTEGRRRRSVRGVKEVFRSLQRWEVPPLIFGGDLSFLLGVSPPGSRAMEPSVSAEVEGEAKERKKIHFAVPASAPTNLDPRQVEMIRRRRPTPATLFRVADQSSPEDDQSTHQWVVGENGVLKPKRVNPNVYQPPSLKAVQKMAEAHMQNLGVYPPLEDPYEVDEDEDNLQRQEEADTSLAKAAARTERKDDFHTDQQDTATSGNSVRFCETPSQIPAAPEEEEEGGGKVKETTEGSSRGSN